MRWLRAALVGTVLLSVGAAFVTLWTRATGGVPGYDIYQYWLPNMLYALQRTQAGGSGLLWNPFQNCGQPSFGISSTGLLYPLNILFLFLDPHRAMLAQLVVNFAVAGAGMYCLTRELGASPAAALCGALAFELGTATVEINMWTLQVSDAYVWIPMILFFCERLLHRPSLGGTVGLGASIAVSLLSGSPQVIVYTYQLVALRVVFEYATRRPRPSGSLLAAIACGLMLGPLLDAVHLVPGLQTAAASVRAGGLSWTDMQPELSVDLTSLHLALMQRADGYNPIILIPFALASASWLCASTRRYALFYAAAGALMFVLAFGPATPLFLLYTKLPLANLFRAPDRFVWMTSVCVAVLTGLGADAILRGDAFAGRQRRYAAALSVMVAVAGFYSVTRNLRPQEWTLVVMVIAAAIVAHVAQHGRRFAALLIIVATAFNLLTYTSFGLPDAVNALATRLLSVRRLLPDETVYSQYGDLLTALRDRMTPQDRIYITRANWNFALAPKIASLYQLPSVDDYEPQPSRRWAEYLVMLRSGNDMTRLGQSYNAPVDRFPSGARRPLLDLAAVRYVIVDATVPSGIGKLAPPLSPLLTSSDSQVKVYENQQALPRAFYVPRVEVVPDPARLLRRLASGRDNLRQVALLDAPPPSGFKGTADPAADGGATFLVDQPERVVVRMHATAPGFLHVADQYATGWYATVNGAPTPVLRANHVFRAVEVPAGESLVELRYAPASLWLGAAITGATLVAILAAAIFSRRRSRHAGAW